MYSEEAPHLINNSEGQYVENAVISSGQLVASREPNEDTGASYNGDYATYYKYQDEVVASAEDRFYVEWGKFLYWSNSAGLIKRYDGTTVVDIGNHTAPTSTITLAKSSTGLLDGDYTYCFTYLHDESFESAPGDLVSIAAVSNEKVTVTFNDGTPPSTATHRLIYRSGGLNPTFNQVAKTPIADTTYVDNTSDFLISRKELNTTENDGAISGLDMLVETSGTLFGAIDNKIYFSKEGQPEYWSDYSYVEVPTEVTGLGVVGGSVIAFTEEDMYVIVGTNIMNIYIQKLPYSYGCKHKRTVQSLKGRLVWLSATDEYDLLCSFDGATVTLLNETNLQATSGAIVGSSAYSDFGTETYDGYSFDIKNSLAVGRKYYLFLTNRTVVVDFETNIKTYYMKESVDGGYVENNQMMIIKDSKIYNYLTFSTDYRDIKYITKDLSDGELTREKSYRKININGSGNWEITVYVDGQSVFIFDYTQGNTIHIPSGIHGKVINFQIVSDGYALINALAYEFDYLKTGYKTVA